MLYIYIYIYISTHKSRRPLRLLRQHAVADGRPGRSVTIDNNNNNNDNNDNDNNNDDDKHIYIERERCIEREICMYV